MRLSEILKQDAAAMYGAAEGLFGRVDDLDWKPATGKNWLTTRQLLRHTAEACGHTMKGFLTGEWGMEMEADTPPGDPPPEEMLPPAGSYPAVDSLEEARERLAEDREMCMTMLSELSDERLLGERSAPPWGGPERTLLQHLQECVWHLGQHKGQLFYYLKLQGKDVNTMDLWGGAA